MAKTLRTIKFHVDDAEYRKYLEKEAELIKKRCNINPQATVYFLCHHKWKDIFLIDGDIYISLVSCEMDEKRKTKISTMDFVELYKISLFKDYPKTLKDIAFEVKVLRDPRYTFTPDEFFDWVDMPSGINIDIDAPYYEIIKFLKTYTKETFETDRYLFYPKKDDDPTYIVNFYAYDKKINKEMKLYIPNKCENIHDNWVYVAPTLLRDIVVDDLENSISGYLKRECKKAFIEYANKENPIFNVKNYWVMELTKQTVQPANILHEWSRHRAFTGLNTKFTNIWVYDHPSDKEEPYFFITDSSHTGDATKVAVLNFKSPTYHVKGIYKKGNVKAKGWELDEQYIKELIEFLKSPSTRINTNNFSEEYAKYYKKYVKTKWQELIFEYNHNSAGWGWGETGFSIPPEKDMDRHSDVEALSFDLAIPNYMELARNTSNNDIE